jgi:hypothetical protein
MAASSRLGVVAFDGTESAAPSLATAYSAV